MALHYPCISDCTRDSNEIQVAIASFESQAIPRDYWEYHTPHHNQTGSGKFKMAALSLQICVSQFVHRQQRKSKGYTKV